MDLPYGSDLVSAFVTNVGLVTSDGPWGINIMAAEWTHLLSYKPGLVAVCIGPSKATAENIAATKEFGVSIAATDQNVLSSLAGNFHAKEFRKFDALKELGFSFIPSKQIAAPLVEGSALRLECRLVDTWDKADHVMFIGEALEAFRDLSKTPLAYHKGKYWTLGENIPKPAAEELEKYKRVMEKHKR